MTKIEMMGEISDVYGGEIAPRVYNAINQYEEHIRAETQSEISEPARAEGFVAGYRAAVGVGTTPVLDNTIEEKRLAWEKRRAASIIIGL